jgi:hypothetical protein
MTSRSDISVTERGRVTVRMARGRSRPR